MKKLLKSLSCVTAAVLVFNAASFIPAAKAEAVAVQLCELRLDELSIGTKDIPGGILTDGSPSKMFQVTAEDESISQSGKALLGSGDGPEIYFDTSEPIVASGVSEDTDYFIKIKMRTHTTSSNDMQYKAAFLAKDNYSKRVAFIGIQGNKLLFTNKTIKGDQWYNYFIRLHVGKNGGETYLGEKIYPVGEAEPEEWDIYSNADSISNHYDIYTVVDRIGVKGWLQNGCGLAGFSAYKYGAESAVEYDAIRRELTDISTAAEGMGTDEVNALLDGLQARIDAFPGNAQELLSDAIKPVYEEMDKLNAAEAEFSALKELEITSDTIFQIYQKAESIKASVSGSVFTGIGDALCAEIDNWVGKNLESAYDAFTASDDMSYSSGASMSGGSGWDGSWGVTGTVSQNNGFVLNGTAERSFASPIDTAFNCEYVFELKDVLTGDSGFMAECGGIRFGARSDGVSVYPVIGDTVGTTALKSGEKYTYMLRANTEGTVKLRVYNRDSVISEPPEVSASLTVSDGALIKITADGTSFGRVSKEVYPVNYAGGTEAKLFELIQLLADTEEALAQKEVLVNEMKAAVDGIRSGAVRDYVNLLLEKVEDDVIVSKLDSLIKKLEKSTTKDDTESAAVLVGSLKNPALKTEYEQKVKEFEDYIVNTAPVIESVGIEGEIKADKTVTAKVSINDPIGNGAGYKAEWLINGGVAGTGDVFSIPSKAGTKKLSLRITALNTAGKEGSPVTTDPVTISGQSQGSTVFGGGGGGGSANMVTPSVSLPTDAPDATPSVTAGDTGSGNTPEPSVSFIDVSGHWAEDDIMDLVQRGVINGMDKHHFAPDNRVTRAEFVKMLTTAICIDPIEYNDCFSDVSAEDWFAGYAAAANAENIAAGDDNMNFSPDAAVTREQAALMLIRAYKRYYSNIPTGDVDSFADADSVSDWAYTELKSALGAGLINGRSETELAPQQKTTRAEAAVMIKRLITGIIDES